MEKIQYDNSCNLSKRGGFHSKHASRNWFDWLAYSIPINEKMKILDVGCGAGWFWKHATARLPKDLELILTDLSPGMVKEAQQNIDLANHYRSAKTEVANAEALPFEDNTFDCVIAMHVLYHTLSPMLAIKEMTRVLKPDGLIAITTNARDNMREMFDISSSFFGGNAIDPAADLFDMVKAKEYLEEFFDTVSISIFKDKYSITDPSSIVSYITSFPPGNEADEEQKNKFHTYASSRIKQNSNVIHTHRISALICNK